MKDNLIVTPDNMAVFERSLDMLDTSIRELRRVAHNMMPESLLKLSLNEANGYKATITGLANGIYFVTGQNGNSRFSEKVIINKQ